MKKLKWILFLIIFSFSCFANDDLDSVLEQVSNEAASKLNINSIVCVLDFTATTKDMSEYIQNQLVSNFLDIGRFNIVTRAEMDKIDKELKYQMSGVVSDSTALSICERLGANAIMFGQLKELDNSYNLQVKILNVEKGTYILFKTYKILRSSKTEQLLGRGAVYCKTSLGTVIECNKNSINYVAPGVGLYFDYNFTRSFTIGLKGFVSMDVGDKNNTIYTLEPLGIFRYYIVSPSGEPSTGIFVEADFGGSLIFSNGNTNFVFAGGGNIGFRKEFNTFYIEPSLRFGYPYLFGADIAFGIRI